MTSSNKKYIIASISIAIISIIVAGAAIYYAVNVKKDADKNTPNSNTTADVKPQTNTGLNGGTDQTNPIKPTTNGQQDQSATSNSPIKVAPKNLTGLTKLVNASLDSSQGGPSSCGIIGVTEYRPTDGNRGNMLITSSALKLDSDQMSSFNNLKDLLNGAKAFDPASVNYTSHFINSCSGFAGIHKFIDAKNVAYAGTDKSQVIYALQGQDLLLSPVVIIFASKGDNQIWLQAGPAGFDYISVAMQCGWKPDATFQNFDEACYENKLKADPQLKAMLDDAAKTLVADFAIV